MLEKSLRNVILLFFIYKLLVIAAALVGSFVPFELSAQATPSDNWFLNLFVQYDSLAYLDIAENGYNSEFNEGTGNHAWYPLYPLLIKLFSYVFGYALAAFLISNILSFVAVYLLYVLLKKDFGEKIAYSSVFYFLFFPTAYFLTMTYTEPLFLCLIIGMFLLAKEGKWGYVGVLGFLASLTRMYGLIMFFPMLYIYLDQRKAFDWNPLKIKYKKLRLDVFYLLLIPLGIFALFSYYYIITGNFFMQFVVFAHPLYHFSVSFPGANIVLAFVQMFSVTSFDGLFYLGINVVFGVVFIAAIVLSLLYLPLQYGIYMLFYGLLTFSHTSVNANMRYYLLMFPAFVLLAKFQHKKYVRYGTYAAYALFIVLMVLFVIRHVNTSLDFIGLFKHLISG